MPFINNIDTHRFLPYLIEAAQRLEKAGATFLVMPCNSLHTFIDDIKKAVHIPVISIVDETIATLKEHKFFHVAFMSTVLTIKNKVYDSAFHQNDINYISPNAKEQKQLSNMIVNLITGKKTNQDAIDLPNIINSFEDKSVDCIVLACTDLQLLNPRGCNLKILDTMDILANSVVKILLE